MDRAGLAPAVVDEALAWRHDLALKLIRGMLVIFLASAVVIWLVMPSAMGRTKLISGALIAALVVSIPAITGRPRGDARAWLILVPALAMALSGYAFVGTLSGPGVSTTVTLMLAGLLLGRRAMILLMIVGLPCNGPIQKR